MYQKADHIGLFCCASSNFCNQPELIGLSEELPLPLHTLTNKARVGIAIPPTNVFPVLGKIAEESLELIGEEHFINAAYSNTTISVEEFNKLKKQGSAVTPKTVKDSVPAYFPMQELILTSVLF